MTHTTSLLPIGLGQPGTRRTVTVHRFGTPGARPKAYIQAGLHADETPGLLVAHHLVRQLAEAARGGLIPGEILVVPVANPIGLDQRVEGVLVGRHALDGGGNFNRHFPDLTDGAAERVRGRLGADAATNAAIVRAALAEALADEQPGTEVQALRHLLLGLAIDADLVLDLHCDSDAVMHLYTGTALWPDAADIAAELGALAVFLADRSGGDPFDEACSAVWWKLRDRLGQTHPLPPGCLAATVELRGQADVDDEQAESDARALMRVLQRRRLVGGTPGPLRPLLCAATPLSGVDRVRAPVAGIVAYAASLGERVAAGSLVAEIVDPAAEDPRRARTRLHARAAGVLWGRCAHKMVAAGTVVASIAGAEPIDPGHGGGDRPLLQD